MNSQTDQQLLRNYTERRSEAAFAELVRRHVDFVYSAALRMVRDAHLAEDVTQSVFVALAQNARQLTNRPVLSGWLHRTAQNLAANAVRTDVRRRAREQEAAAMNELLSTESDATWEHIAPHLDAALGELSEPDRDALLLRYFERKSAREMAQTLGMSEDAAQKRVTRAVERLREFFAKRGVTVGAGGLVVVLSANAVQAAPVGLAVTISTAAALAGTTLVTTATATTVKTIAMTTLQKALVTTITVAAVGIAIYALQQQSQIRSLQQQQASLTAQVEELNRQRDDAANQLAALQSKNEQLRRDAQDVLRLRAEVTQLQRQPVSQAPAPAPVALAATNTAATASEPQIHIAARFVTLPSEAVKNLGVWSPNPQGGSMTLMSAQQFKNVSEALQGASDADVLGAPQIIVLNGRQARMSITQAVPIAGANGTGSVSYTNVGVSLGVTPHFNPASASFDLELVPSLTQLIGDASQPEVHVMQASNRVAVAAGQTAVLVNDMPSGGWLPDHTNVVAGPKSLLVFVTPQIVDSRGNLVAQ